MKRILFLALALMVIAAGSAAAQTVPQGTPGTGIGPNFVDLNGDGICDTYQSGARAGKMQGRGGFGPADGSGNKGVGPRDGSGFGAKAGAGVCDGTGPKGSAARRGGKR